ncbi:hypothetical protein PR048_022508 [Dryococelus australis]|uniref:Uncharacterized protein n=1 Tax=Dryococelus australis TaxID=614101 RepID=A0ABQ9H188_9NEOP|nr:hypothetical protein PR048_022508 [Dryococelus australis]
MALGKLACALLPRHISRCRLANRNRPHLARVPPFSIKLFPFSISRTQRSPPFVTVRRLIAGAQNHALRKSFREKQVALCIPNSLQFVSHALDEFKPITHLQENNRIPCYMVPGEPMSPVGAGVFREKISSVGDVRGALISLIAEVYILGCICALCCELGHRHYDVTSSMDFSKAQNTDVWAALNIEVSRANEGVARGVWSSARIPGLGKRKIPKKTYRPVASSGMIPTCGKSGSDLDKIDVKHVYNESDFAIGSQFIKHALEDSDPIADLQGNKEHQVHRGSDQSGPALTAAVTMPRRIQLPPSPPPTTPSQPFHQHRAPKPRPPSPQLDTPPSIDRYPLHIEANCRQKDCTPVERLARRGDEASGKYARVTLTGHTSRGLEISKCRRRGGGDEARTEQRRNAREIPEKTRRPAASSSTITTCDNPGTTPPPPGNTNPRLDCTPPNTAKPIQSPAGATSRIFTSGEWGFVRELPFPGRFMPVVFHSHLILHSPALNYLVVKSHQNVSTCETLNTLNNRRADVAKRSIAASYV